MTTEEIFETAQRWGVDPALVGLASAEEIEVIERIRRDGFLGPLRAQASGVRFTIPAVPHSCTTVLAADGNGSYCRLCGE